MTLKEDIYCLLDWTEECINTNEANDFIRVAYNYIVNYLDLTNNQKIYRHLKLIQNDNRICLYIMGIEMIIENQQDEIVFIKKVLKKKHIVARYSLISDQHSIMNLKIATFHPSYFLTILEEVYFESLSSAAGDIRIGKFYLYI